MENLDAIFINIVAHEPERTTIAPFDDLPSGQDDPTIHRHGSTNTGQSDDEVGVYLDFRAFVGMPS
jgi:hypothetical protein